MGQELQIRLEDIDLNNALQLIGIIKGVYDNYANGERIDVGQAIDHLEDALGVSVAEEAHVAAEQAIRTALVETFNDEEAAEQLTQILLACGAPIATAVSAFARGVGVEKVGGKLAISASTKIDAEALAANLFDVYNSTSDEMLTLLSKDLGIEAPPELMDIANKYSIEVVSVLAFMAAYKIYCKAAEDAKLAHERRLQIERECAEAVALISEHRAQMEALVNSYMLENIMPFEAGVAAMDQAIIDGDDDGYIAANAQLWQLLGHKAQYSTAQEFDDLMLSDETFKL